MIPATLPPFWNGTVTHEDSAIYGFMFDALASSTDDLSQDGMVAMVMVRVAHGWQFGPNTQ
ncbi:MAG: hypothetical protein JXP73_19570, partial [Deltaproteobacteria bacterium]|nr:hypothetical protein [Deltaproteobacteria bacterium]